MGVRFRPRIVIPVPLSRLSFLAWLPEGLAAIRIVEIVYIPDVAIGFPNAFHSPDFTR
jgi:hypothetical protein